MKLIPALEKSRIEPLEARIAPASVAIFQDTDGDIITVKNAGSGNLNDPTQATFTLPPLGADGIQEINLNSALFQNDTITITVKAAPGGDGLINIGAINASALFPPASGAAVTTVDLKAITVQGDVGRIAVGTGAGATAGLGSLKVQSLGVADGGAGGGVGVQVPGDTTNTTIAGNLGKLTVLGDIFSASIFISGNLGATTIGGSLIGANFLNSGSIFTGNGFPTGAPTGPGNAGAVKIGGSIIGGAGLGSGGLFIAGNLPSLTIGGDLVGGAGDQLGGTGGAAGTVLVSGPLGIGAVKIGGSIIGDPLAVNPTAAGGNFVPFADSGSIRTFAGPIGSLTVGGSILGGAGLFGGYVQSVTTIGSVKVGGDIRGDVSAADRYNNFNRLGFNGGIQARGSMGPVSVGGSVVGGYGNYSGVIFVGNEDFNIPAGPFSTNVAAVTPGVTPNIPDFSGNPPSQLYIPPNGSGAMGAVKIGGSVTGASGGSLTNNGGVPEAASGWIKSDGPMGKVSIGGDVLGGRGQYSGSVQSHTSIASVTVKGSIVGGLGFDSGSVFAGSPEFFAPLSGAPILPASTGVGAVKIGGSLIAGLGNLSGTLYDDTLIKSVTIGGNIVGDQSARFGLAAPGGAIVSGGALGPIVIKGSIIGGVNAGPGNINAYGGNIASVSVGRDIISPSTNGTPTTGIYAAGNLGPVKVGGSISGAFATGGEVFLLADGSITSVTVKGRVQFADIMAGSTFYGTVYGNVTTASNPDAFIGPVKVGGDWVASSIVAGLTSNQASGAAFGTAGNAIIDEGIATAALNNNGIASRIASITIGGRLFGTAGSGGGDGYVFAAEAIGALKLHGSSTTAAFLAPAGVLVSLTPVGDADVFIFVLGGN